MPAKMYLGLCTLLAIGCAKNDLSDENSAGRVRESGQTQSAGKPYADDCHIWPPDVPCLVETIRGNITPETLGELSCLVHKSPVGTAERGGRLYLEERLVFYEIPNMYTMRIAALQSMNPNRPKTINFELIEETIRSLEVEHTCSGRGTDEFSEVTGEALHRLKQARQSIGKKDFNRRFYRAVNYLANNLRLRYLGMELNNADVPAEGFLGHLHTHNDASGFSDIDLCISRKTPMYLVTHNYPNAVFFELHVAFESRQALIGRFGLEKCEN